MSSPMGLRRADKMMDEVRAHKALAAGYCGRLASVGPDGWPYAVPLLYVLREGQIWLHNTSAPGHLRTNVLHDDRVCFEFDDAGEVFPYGRFDCDTAIAYRSVIAFGRIRVVASRAAKREFFDAFMAKYGARRDDRPAGVYPRLDLVTVYAMTIERMTGKETTLPAADERWPVKDRTKSPDFRGG